MLWNCAEKHKAEYDGYKREVIANYGSYHQRTKQPNKPEKI